MIRAGNLRNRLEFRQKSESFDAYGKAVRSWATFVTTWGSVTKVPTGESWVNDRVLNDLAIAFKIRFYPGLTTDMQVVYNGVEYEIVSIVDPIGNQAELIVLLRASI